MAFICGKCGNRSMRVRNGFSSCSVCSNKILNIGGNDDNDNGDTRVHSGFRRSQKNGKGKTQE